MSGKQYPMCPKDQILVVSMLITSLLYFVLWAHYEYVGPSKSSVRKSGLHIYIFGEQMGLMYMCYVVARKFQPKRPKNWDKS